MTFRPDPKPGTPSNNLTAKEYREAVKKKRPGNKLNAQSQVYNGIRYDSKLEAAYAQQLDIRLKLGEIESIERQVKLDLRVNGKHLRNYYIDFKETYPDGSIVYTEVKGFPTELWKMKFDLLILIRGDILEAGAIIALQTKNARKVY